MSEQDQAKQAAARASLQFVKDGQVVGLGTGSTAKYFIELLGEKVRQGLRIRAIASSIRSQEQASSLGIPITNFDECQQIDVTVDGADEVDPQLRLIKGGGGALLREKIVASATKQFVIIVDASKRVPVLGRFPLPVEVIKFARPLVEKESQLSAQESNSASIPAASPISRTKTTTSSTATSAKSGTPTPSPGN